MIENQAKHCEDLEWSGILDVFWFQLGVNSFQREKTSVQVSAVQKLIVSLKLVDGPTDRTDQTDRPSD